MYIITEGKMLEFATMMDKGMSFSSIVAESNLSIADANKLQVSINEMCSLDEETYISEAPISRAERLKRGFRMKRKARFMQMKKKISQRRMPDQKKAQKLSRKSAISTLKKKIGKKSVSAMSTGEKSRVEARVKKLGGVVNRMSRKLMPTVKTRARKRIANRNAKNEGVTLLDFMDNALYEFIVTEAKKDDPCWKSHEMVGMKKKNGKDVPNCVPKNEDAKPDFLDKDGDGNKTEPFKKAVKQKKSEEQNESTADELRKEMAANKKKFDANKAKNSVKDDFPKMNKGFTYKKR
jgi:hypothetical protein